MKKLSRENSGFSIFEVTMVIVIAGLIGSVGWLAYQNHRKFSTVASSTVAGVKPAASAPTSSNTNSASAINPYASWQSFCSSYGGLCLKYPSNWTIKTTSEPTTVSLSTHIANITSPSGNVTVEYQPYCAPLTAPPAGKWTDNIVSVTSPTSTTDFKVIRSISDYQGGGTSSNISENLYLASNAVIQQNGLTVGTHTNTTGLTDESGSGFFANTKASHPNNMQCINVGSLKHSTGGNYLNFSTTSDARAWLNSNEAQIAYQILGSVSYN